MPSRSYDAPARLFLGEDALGAGPFGLLGLPVEAADEDTVFAALERRLAQIDAHRHSQTPEADDARLALHAAAAQLMDPQVQRALLERWAEGGGSEEEVGAMIDAELERQAMLLLSGGGPGNSSALHRLSLLARSHGIPIERLVESIVDAARREPGDSIIGGSPPGESRERARGVRGEPGVPEDGAGVVPPPAWMDEQHKPGSVGQVILLLGVAVVGLGAIAAISIVVLADRLGAVFPQQQQAQQQTQQQPQQPSQQTPQQASGQQQAGAGAGSPVNGATPQPEAPPPPDAAEIRGMLADASSTLELDPQIATADFRRAVELASAHWLDHRPDQRVAIRSEVVAFVHRAGAWPNAPARAIDAIAEHLGVLRAERAPGESELRRAIWALGVLARLRADRDLPASARLAIDEALVRSGADTGFAGGVGFERGALAGASRLGIRMARAAPPGSRAEGDQELRAWESWLACVEALEPSPGPTRDRVILGALDAIVFAGGEGERLRAGIHAVRLLAPALSWGEDAEARPWLLRVAGSQRADASLVRAMMRTLSEEVPESMVGPAQIPSTQALQADRARIREALARLWGMDQADRADELGYTLAGHSRNWIQQSESAIGAEEQLASAARLARLNLASAMRFAGRYDEASLVLDQTESVVEGARRSGGRVDGLFAYGNDEHRWGVTYLQLGRRIEPRVAMLEELGRSPHTLGWMEADILVSEALRGDAPRVRVAAGEVVQRVIGQPRVLNAFLEVLPDAPMTRRSAELIEMAAGEMLPPVDDPSFMYQARRALVVRLLRLVSEERDGVVLDRLSLVMAEAYAEASVIDEPDTPFSLGDDAGPLDGAEPLLRYWMSLAGAAHGSGGGYGVGDGGLTPGAIESRMNARLNLADGPVQAFCAYQIAICEAMALVVVAERPGVAPEVESVLRAFEDERRVAEHVIGQVGACERAIARLWRIRLDLIGGG